MLNELQKKTVTAVTAQLLYMEQRCKKPKQTQNKQHDTSLIPKHKWSHSLQSKVEVN